MYAQVDEVRHQVADFAASVIEQHEKPMTSMDFNLFIMNKELSSSDERLVQAICDSKETHLKTLKLGSNCNWWKNATLRQLLWNFVFS